MNDRTPRRSTLEKLAARIDLGNRIAGDVEMSTSKAPIAFRHELRSLAARVRLCNSPENSWHTPNAITDPSTQITDSHANPSNQTYEAVGRFWRCGSKLCPDCLARQSRNSRKRLREALNAQKPQRGDRYYFVTFTIPNIGLSLVESRSIVANAWTLFRKRLLCVSLIRGGSKTEEFTVTAKGFHYHLHCLWLAKYMSYQEVRRNWTECVSKSFEEHDREFICNNSDGMLSVVVKKVIPNERIVQEVCKYITKSDSWSKLPTRDLVEVAMIRKWHRMFELFGSFRSLSTSDSGEPEPIVHTRSLSDGGPPAVASYWRDRIASLNYEDYLSELYEEWHRCVNGRLRQLELRWKDATIRTYAEIAAKRAGP